MKALPVKRWAAALLLAAGLATAQAGRPCEEKPQTLEQLEQGLALAQATARQLDATGAQVLVLARAGQDLARYGLRWSHAGLVYRTGDGERAVWRVVHKLNHCGTEHAALYRQGLGEFFLDAPHRYEASFVVLKPELQRALLPVLADNTRVLRFEERRYNLVAYPFATRYQQSNQWVLEMLAAAAEPGLASRSEAQAWLRTRGYTPTVLQLSAMTRLGGRLTQANVAFDDHPSVRRFAGQIETVTVDSMWAWLPAAGLSGPAQTVGP